MNFDHKPSCVLITGKKGSGKTTYWLRYVVAHRAKFKFYFDPSREVSRKLRLPICIDVPAMTRAVCEGRVVCFDPSPLFPGDRRAGFAFFCRYVFNVCRALRGVKLVGCDEYQSVQRPGDSGLPPGMKQIADEGRREEIDCAFSSQRLNEVNDDVRGHVTELITFKHTDSLSLDWIERCASDMGCTFDRATVSNLATPGQFLRFTDDGKTSASSAPERRKKADPAGVPDRAAAR